MNEVPWLTGLNIFSFNNDDILPYNRNSPICFGYF